MQVVNYTGLRKLKSMLSGLGGIRFRVSIDKALSFSVTFLLTAGLFYTGLVAFTLVRGAILLIGLPVLVALVVSATRFKDDRSFLAWVRTTVAFLARDKVFYGAEGRRRLGLGSIRPPKDMTYEWFGVGAWYRD